MRRVSDRHLLRGFTLVEMIIAIVITGILVGIVGMFGRRQIDSYIDVSNRADLSDAADTALRRIARDLQAALPNSVRLDTSSKILEFVPIMDAGRYRAAAGGIAIPNRPECVVQANDDPLEFLSEPNNTFDVLGPPVSIRSGEQVVVFNLGQSGSTVYEGSSSRPANTTGSQLCKVGYSGPAFTLASPQNRFQVVGMPVTYECAANAANPLLGTVIRHSGYGFQPAQPTSFGALGGQSAVLVGDVSACAFSYIPAVLQRNGLVVLRLTLTRNGESVNLLQQVDILNTP